MPGHDVCLFLFDQILTEWRGGRKLLGRSLYISALAREMVGEDNRVSLIYVPADDAPDKSSAQLEAGEPVGAER